MLALAVRVLCDTYSPEEKKSKVFGGTFTEKNFNKWVTNMLSDHEDDFSMIVDTASVGTHSWKKGVKSHILAGSTAGPPTSTVLLRSGQSLGQPTQRYIFMVPAGDEYAGRIAAGLNLHESSFMTLPPHFKEITPEMKAVIVSVTPSYEKYPRAFRTVLPLLVASAVYHSEYLLATLPKTHPLFSAKLFRERIYEQLKATIATGLGTCSITGMTATGIPPHVTALKRVEELEEKVAALTAKTEIQTAAIQELTHMLMGNNSVGGVPVVDLNRSLQDTLLTFKQDMLAACTLAITAALAPRAGLHSPPASTSTAPPVDVSSSISGAATVVFNQPPKVRNSFPTG